MKRNVIYLLLALAALLTACDRRPLEEDSIREGEYAEILLLTNWSQLEEVPTGMTAMFYPEDGGTPTVLMSNNTVGNTIRLKRGKYKALVFNQSIYEFGAMTFDGMDKFESACVRAVGLTESVTQETAADLSWFKKTVNNNPDSLAKVIRSLQPFNADRFVYEVTEDMCRKQWEKEQDEADDSWGGVTQHAFVDTIYSTPPPVAPTMHITIHVKGIDNAYMARAYISNMARADRFGPHYNTAEEAIQVISNWQVTISEDDKTRGDIKCSFRTFGVPSMQVTENDIYMEYGSHAARRDTRNIVIDHGENRLYVEFMLKDGQTTVVHEFDVTEDIDYEENELVLNVELNIDAPLPVVPDVIGAGGAGFDADVEEWVEEDHDIHI